MQWDTHEVWCPPMLAGLISLLRRPHGTSVSLENNRFDPSFVHNAKPWMGASVSSSSGRKMFYLPCSKPCIESSSLVLLTFEGVTMMVTFWPMYVYHY